MWKLTLAVSFFVSCAFCQNGVNIYPLPAQKLSAPLAPHWDAESRSLYWTNFRNSGNEPAVCRYSYDNNAVYCASLPGTNTASFILPNADGTFTVGVGNAVQIIKWDGVSNQAFFSSNQFSLDSNTPGALAGYGRSAPASRFFGGTFSSSVCYNVDYSQHNVYRYDNQTGLVNIIAGAITGGIVFDTNKNIMYQLEPCRLFITAYDWNRNTGDVCNPRIAVNFKAIGFNSYLNSPLSLGIDTSGNLYTATQDGTVLIIDPVQGIISNTITMPVKGAFGVIFGGPKLDILYVVAGSDVVNFYTAKTAYTVSDGTSLYAVTGVGQTFTDSNTRLNVFPTQS